MTFKPSTEPLFQQSWRALQRYSPWVFFWSLARLWGHTRKASEPRTGETKDHLASEDFWKATPLAAIIAKNIHGHNAALLNNDEAGLTEQRCGSDMGPP